MFYLTTHSTHFILRLYGVRHMVKDHSDSVKGNPLPPHRLLLSINSKGSFICTISQTGENIPRRLLHQSWSTGWNDQPVVSEDYIHITKKYAHSPPATHPGRTACTPLYPSVQAVPPPPVLTPFFLSQRRPIPVPVTGVRYNSLL